MRKFIICFFIASLFLHQGETSSEVLAPSLRLCRTFSINIIAQIGISFFFFWNSSECRECGFPGRPNNGSSKTAAPQSRPGDTVVYSCRPGFVLFGEHERVCLDSGIWAGKLPICDLNLAVERTALLSATLWNYRAALAVDGNPDTCSFTPRTAEQRWWQLDLGQDFHVASVGLILSKDSYQEFTIFIIQLLSRNQALYKPCSTFKGRFQRPRALFQCNDGQGHQGRFVYIRDDRQEQDYFGLCEVEVFSFKETTPCGEAEEPVAGHVSVSPQGEAVYSCDPGYQLQGEPSRPCQSDGHWEGHAPQCIEIQCQSPPTTTHGFPDVSGLNGKYPYGTVITYKCQVGYVVWGNATRVCTGDAQWSGSTPQCKPISCDYPPTYPHASVELLNRSTLWNTVAMYSCEMGFSLSSGISRTFTTCLDSGIWDDVNITCIRDDKRNLPVKLLGGGWNHHNRNSEDNSDEDAVGTPGLIAIVVFCFLLLIVFVVLGIVLARRFQSSKKPAEATPQSSTNDLIVSNGKTGMCNDTATSGLPTITTQQATPQNSPDKNSQGTNLLPLLNRTQDTARYNALQSFPSVSSYNSTAATDTEDEMYAKIRHGDGHSEKSKRSDDPGYESIKSHSDIEHIDPEYETVRHFQQIADKPGYDAAKVNGKVGGQHKSNQIPAVLKLFPSSPQTNQGETSNPNVPPEILALYAQVDKSKKKKYRSDNQGIEDTDPDTITSSQNLNEIQDDTQQSEDEFTDSLPVNTRTTTATLEAVSNCDSRQNNRLPASASKTNHTQANPQDPLPETVMCNGDYTAFHTV